MSFVSSQAWDKKKKKKKTAPTRNQTLDLRILPSYALPWAIDNSTVTSAITCFLCDTRPAHCYDQQSIVHVNYPTSLRKTLS